MARSRCWPVRAWHLAASAIDREPYLLHCVNTDWGKYGPGTVLINDIDIRKFAVLLDVDGTLLDIAADAARGRGAGPAQAGARGARRADRRRHRLCQRAAARRARPAVRAAEACRRSAGHGAELRVNGIGPAAAIRPGIERRSARPVQGLRLQARRRHSRGQGLSRSRCTIGSRRSTPRSCAKRWRRPARPIPTGRSRCCSARR